MAVPPGHITSSANGAVDAGGPVTAPRVAAVGYCSSAAVAFEFGRDGPDREAIVGLHLGLTNIRPADRACFTRRVLMCIAADDPILPLEHRITVENEMRAAGVDWQIHLCSGAVRSFVRPRASHAG